MLQALNALPTRWLSRSSGKAWRHALAMLLLITGACGGASAQTPEPPKLSLDDFLQRARRDTAAVDAARAKLAGYRALFNYAYRAWLPTLKIESLLAPLPERKLLRQCVDQTPGADGLFQVSPCPGQDVLDDEKLTADTEIGILTRTTARVTFPIYTFGKVEAGQRAARAGVEVGRAGVDYARAKLSTLVKEAYYGAQLAASALDILNDGRRRMRSARKQIDKELKKETGKFTSNDLRKLIVEQSEIEASYLETDALRDVAWEGLRIAGGFTPDQSFELDTLKLQPVHMQATTAAAAQELSALSRPDLRMARAAVQARIGQLELAKAERLPDIALVGAFGFAKGTTAEDNPDPFANDTYNFLRWGVVLGANWNIDFAQDSRDVQEAEAEVASARAQLALLTDKVRLEVVERFGLVTRYQREMAVRETALSAAKAWLVSNSLNFGVGLVSTDDLLRSLVAYSKARLKHYNAIYQYNLAVARLSETVGTELSVPHPDEGAQ